MWWQSSPSACTTYPWHRDELAPCTPAKTPCCYSTPQRACQLQDIYSKTTQMLLQNMRQTCNWNPPYHLHKWYIVKHSLFRVILQLKEINWKYVEEGDWITFQRNLFYFLQEVRIISAVLWQWKTCNSIKEIHCSYINCCSTSARQTSRYLTRHKDWKQGYVHNFESKQL